MDADVESIVAGSEGQWFSALVGYLQANPNVSWTYRALNSEDRYALLGSGYAAMPANASKQAKLASIQFAAAASSGNTAVLSYKGATTAVYGTTNSLTVQVAGVSGAGVPTGSVSLSVDGGMARPVVISGAQALFPAAALGAGSHALQYGKFAVQRSGDGTGERGHGGGARDHVQHDGDGELGGGNVPCHGDGGRECELRVYGSQGTLTVTSAAAISWAAPAAIVYGTALSAAQLDATSSVPLTLTYNPPAGSVLNAGTQTLNVSGVSTTNAVPVTSAVALLVQTASTSVLASAPSTPSNPYTVTATVTSGNGGSVTGPVNFFDGGALIGSSQVDAKGTATFAISPLASGPHSFTATYPGNSNNLQSTSAAVSGTVAFTCTGLRTGASCGFTPSTLVFNNSLLAQTTTVSVSLPAVRASVERRGSLRVWLAMLPGFGGLLLFGRRRGRGALAVCGVLAWRW